MTSFQDLLSILNCSSKYTKCIFFTVALWYFGLNAYAGTDTKRKKHILCKCIENSEISGYGIHDSFKNYIDCDKYIYLVVNPLLNAAA